MELSVRLEWDYSERYLTILYIFSIENSKTQGK